MASGTSAYRQPDEPASPRRPLYSGLVAVFVLIAIAVLVGVIDLLLSGQTLSVSAALASWAWVFNVVLILLAIVIVVWVVRLAATGVGGVPHSRRFERLHERYHDTGGSAPADPAVEIARERFARGEISQEQLDQTLTKLGKTT